MALLVFIYCPTCLTIRLLNYYFNFFKDLTRLQIYIMFFCCMFVIVPLQQLSLYLFKYKFTFLNKNNYQEDYVFNNIGPHNLDVISIIFGSLLGNSEMDKINSGSCVKFTYRALHLEYSNVLFNSLLNLGYCNPESKIITKSLGKKGKLYKIINFSTFYFSSLDWIYYMWYLNNKKTIPICIDKYLTPLALAIFIMDCGVKTFEGLSFNKTFSHLECELLVKALYLNFKIKAKIKYTGTNNKYIICILKDSIPNLKNQIGDYFIPSLKYKLILD